MRQVAILLTLISASLACNLDRVLDPSLPTATPAIQIEEADIPDETAEAAAVEPDDNLLDPLTRADQLFFFGDWAGALDAYELVYASYAEPKIQSEALLGQGRTLIILDEWASAREILFEIQDNYPAEEAAWRAHYHLAQIYIALEDYLSAENAYRAYLETGDSALNSTINEWRGDLFALSGERELAIAAYQSSLSYSRLGNFDNVQSKIGDAYFLSGNFDRAIFVYQDLLLNTQNDYVKSQMDYSIGKVYLELGEEEQAHNLYIDAIENYPLAYTSYLALIDLVNSEIEVSDLHRGYVDYFAATGLDAAGDSGGASELYSLAIAAFDRYLLANPQDHEADVHYYRGLALRALGEYTGSNREWLEIINTHPLDSLYQEAFAQKARTEWAFQGDFDVAVQTLLGFVTSNPGLGRAPEFLFTAAEIAKLDFNLDAAIQIWDRLSLNYPNSDYAYRALFNSAISYIRLDNWEKGQEYFQRALASSENVADRSQTLFWLAKVEMHQTNIDEAIDFLNLASATDPSGYYSERARDLINEVAPFTHSTQTGFSSQLDLEKLEAEAWMTLRFDLDPLVDFSSIVELSKDDRFKRGTEYWQLGEFELARAEFENLRLSIFDDPLANYQLANYLINLGVYRSGIFAIRQVLTIAGMSDFETLSAPAYFNRLRFGTYYLDLIEEAALDADLDPFFILSVIRQESLFEGFVTSSAGARGLMQIIPATGQEIATLSGWPVDYRAEDLYRPLISIAFGSSYLERQSNNFDGNLFASLAAYNAGAGNATYWLSIANEDDDLFVELIDFEETQNYVKSIYEIFSIYSDLYSLE
jgi:soluble lytic murein transglycosylase